MNQVRKALAVLALTHSRNMTQEMADYYIESFEGIAEQDVLKALKRCSMEVRGFPVIADIHQRIKGSEIDEQEVVGLIYEAVNLYGYPSPQKAREHIGEIGWRAVLTCGGWLNICNTPADQDATLRAQLRMAAQSAIRRYKEDPENFTAKLPTIAANKLTSISEFTEEFTKEIVVTNQDFQKDIPF